MADVKWIKITTDVFDDEKILLIESLPEADSIIVIWFKLLCLAGKQNNSGVFMMNNQIAYTDKMLATIFRRKEDTVQLALQTFEQYGMIELIDGVITIPNWNKHQSLDVYERKKARDRLYQSERRAAQKAIAQKSSDNRSTIARQSLDNSPDVAVSEEDKIRIEEDKNKNKKEVRHKYGEYSNVLLTDTDLEKLRSEFPTDWEDRIENLSAYIASTGKSYKNHLATIRNWARKEKQSTIGQVKPKPTEKQSEYNSFMDQLMAMRE